MPLSDARKRANKKYNDAHYSTVAANVRNDLAESFRAACSDSGLTVSGGVAAFVRACVAGDADALRILRGEK